MAYPPLNIPKGITPRDIRDLGYTGNVVKGYVPMTTSEAVAPIDYSVNYLRF